MYATVATATVELQVAAAAEAYAKNTNRLVQVYIKAIIKKKEIVKKKH